MVGIPLIILVQASIIVFALNASLSVSRFIIETDKIGGEVKLLLVTDLHSCDYGDGQIKLINAIDAEHPNAVLLVGDIFDDGLPPENTTEFIEYVSGKYHCYYVSGNHEFWSRRADDFKVILESYGVKVLEGTSEILEVGGDKIRISGIDDPDTDRYPSRSMSYAEQIKRLGEELSNDGLYTILLSHRPERIDELLSLKPDLVLSGHAHGGQWRLPVLLENGLLSPNQGLFPKYTNGKYSFGETTLLVSRGLARESTRVIPRIFNRPEIVVITLK
jgi:predicted MPP superfamily phosphohydrolase